MEKKYILISLVILSVILVVGCTEEITEYNNEEDKTCFLGHWVEHEYTYLPGPDDLRAISEITFYENGSYFWITNYTDDTYDNYSIGLWMTYKVNNGILSIKGGDPNVGGIIKDTYEFNFSNNCTELFLESTTNPENIVHYYKVNTV
jgi:hypothetical protein